MLQAAWKAGNWGRGGVRVRVSEREKAVMGSVLPGRQPERQGKAGNWGGRGAHGHVLEGEEEAMGSLLPGR